MKTHRQSASAPAKVLGYGAWRSPITSKRIVEQVVTLSQLKLVAGTLYWVEARPSEAGRNVVVAKPPSASPADVISDPFSARTRVHEYGGGAYIPTAAGVYFSHLQSQQLYIQASNGSTPVPLTSTPGLRFADGVFDDARSSLISVCEDHTGDPAVEARNYLVRIATQNGVVTTLTSGADFYAVPRLSPDGNSLAWLQWNHPDMPWDAAELWLAEVAADGSLQNARHIAGGGGQAAYQPQWSPGGILHFVVDPAGWWNIFRWTGSAIEAMTDLEAEFGRPLWAMGQSTFAFANENELLCSYVQRGFWNLARIDTRSKVLSNIPIPYSVIFDLQADSQRVALIAGAPASPTSVIELDLATSAVTVHRSSSQISLDPKYVSQPQALEFPTTDNKTAFALYYPPKNDDFNGNPGELPPLIVTIHGGPTSATTAALSLSVQFWTSRGFAVVDVNYGGSTGYGREYRERLREKWGVVDLDDACNAALHLAAQGLVDGNRLAIVGGSAGGYTALCALTFKPDVFKAGVSLYGISDLEALLRDTHKFESRYPFSLIGPYPAAAQRYHDRSPVHFPDDIQSPVLFLQGEDDMVVPPNQTELMANAMLASGKQFGLIMFAGEQHGFRNAENIQRALDAQLDFLSVVLTKSGLRF